MSPKRVWKIKIVPGGNPASVIQFSDNPQLLANLEKQFGLEEVYKSIASVVLSFGKHIQIELHDMHMCTNKFKVGNYCLRECWSRERLLRYDNCKHYNINNTIV